MSRLSMTELEGIGRRLVAEYDQKSLTPEIKSALERLADTGSEGGRSRLARRRVAAHAHCEGAQLE